MTTATSTTTTAPTAVRPFSLIGELMNNSFARARDAFQRRDLAKYRQLAQLQSDLDTKGTALAEAVAANTPAAPPE